MADPKNKKAESDLFAPGTRVEVQNAFDSSWSSGFTVAAASDDGYLLTRGSDGAELPARISQKKVRRERRRSMWWV